jgi:hypothetical protein
MERLYDVLARESKRRRRNVAQLADLSFLTGERPT